MGKTGRGTWDRSRGTGAKGAGWHIWGPPGRWVLTPNDGWIPAGGSSSDASAPDSAILGSLSHEMCRAQQPRAVMGAMGARRRATRWDASNGAPVRRESGVFECPL